MYNRMQEPGYPDKAEGSTEPQMPPAYTSHPPEGGPPPQQMSNYPPPQQQQPMGYALQQPMGYPASSSQQMSNTNTTVVIGAQPAAPQVIIQAPRMWTTGICSCFDDCGVCLLGFFCPCIAECILSTDAGECCCVASCCPIALRTKIRTRHNIHGSVVDDCCMLAFCHPCAMCQMHREVKIHGI